jgi:Protein of unknown function (DUF1236)
MTTLKNLAILVALLAGGTSLAMAQDGASDTVTLSAAQRSAAWKDLSKRATNQGGAGFDATIGTFVPDTVNIEPIPSDVTANNPSLKPYYFAIVDHKLVIVDPSNNVIADVLTTIGHQRPATGEGRVGSVRTKRQILSSQVRPWWWLVVGTEQNSKKQISRSVPSIRTRHRVLAQKPAGRA